MKRYLSACLFLLLGLAACTQPSSPDASISGTLVLPGALGSEGAAQVAQTKGLPPDLAIVSPKQAAVPKGAEVVPGELLVLFGDDSLSAQALTSPYPLRQLEQLSLSFGNLQLLKADGLGAAATKALANQIAAQPGVKAAFPNWRLYALATPNDEFYPFQWHYRAMNLENAWNLETGQTQAVTVAVVDSGIVAHPDLVGKLLPGYDFITDPKVAADGDGRDGDPTDLGQESGYHGSHVAGTVAASTNNGIGVAGVSWGARLVPVRALGVTGGGTASDILEAIVWAAGESVPGVPANPNPASVINMSLGADIGQPCPAEIGAMFRSLGAAGKIIVAAAGNDNRDTATFFPASCDGVVTVGATGPTGARAPYSNYGPAVDLMAPGGDILQTLTVGDSSFPAGVLSTVFDDATQSFAYAFYQGTSMASPHVAGLVALMKARNPALTFDQALAQLQGASTTLSATDCVRPSGSDCGAGLIDAAAALGGSAAPPTPPATGSLATYAVALYCADASCSTFNYDRSSFTTLNPAADTVPFAIANLSSGTYAAAAWQDLNGNQVVDTGEPFGAYPELVPLAAGQRFENATIYLQAFTPQGGTQQLAVPLGETLMNSR